MAWTHTIHTTAGLALRQKQLDSNVTIKFTKAMAGTGTVNPAELAVQTELVNPVQQLELGRAARSNADTSVIIPVTLHNDNLKTDYHVEQVGVYAQDPDAGEILYFISQTDKTGGDEVPSAAKSPGFTLDWNFSLNVGNGSKVEVVVNRVGVLTEEQADDRYASKETMGTLEEELSQQLTEKITEVEEALDDRYIKSEIYNKTEIDLKMASDETADSLFGKPVVFAEAEQDIALTSGDTVKTLFGKLSKTVKLFQEKHSVMEDEISELGGELTNLPEKPVSFTEAKADVDIASGDSLKVMFGKLLKTIKTFRTKHTTMENTLQSLSGTTPISRGGTGETVRYEAVTLARKTTNTPADSTATCRYYPYLKMCFARIYIAPRNTLTYKTGEAYVLYTIPEEYRPSTIHAGSCHVGGSANGTVRVNSAGEIALIPDKDVSTGWGVYITAFWLL